MWFAVMDMQHEKQSFLTEPQLYSIGLSHECFSTLVFFQNVFNAIVNGLLLMVIVFFGIDGTIVDANGWNSSFWQSGTLVYACVVIVVNFKMIHKTNTHTWGSTILISLSILLYFVQFFFENFFAYFPSVYRLFPVMMSNPKTYLIMFLVSWFNYL